MFLHHSLFHLIGWWLLPSPKKRYSNNNGPGCLFGFALFVFFVLLLLIQKSCETISEDYQKYKETKKIEDYNEWLELDGTKQAENLIKPYIKCDSIKLHPEKQILFMESVTFNGVLYPKGYDDSLEVYIVLKYNTPKSKPTLDGVYASTFDDIDVITYNYPHPHILSQFNINRLRLKRAQKSLQLKEVYDLVCQNKYVIYIGMSENAYNNVTGNDTIIEDLRKAFCGKNKYSEPDFEPEFSWGSSPVLSQITLRYYNGLNMTDEEVEEYTIYDIKKLKHYLKFIGEETSNYEDKYDITTFKFENSNLKFDYIVSKEYNLYKGMTASCVLHIYEK